MEQDPSELGRRLAEMEQELTSLAEAYRALERLHDTFFHRAPDGLLGLDAHGRVTDANPAARHLLGLDPVGQRWIDLLEEARPLADGEIRLRSGRPLSVRVAEAPPGAVVTLRAPPEAPFDRPSASDRHLAGVGRIAGGIAHEINNPLTVLQLRVDLLLEEDQLPAALRQQIQIIHESTGRIARTVRTLQRMGAPPQAPAWHAVFDLATTAIEGARIWLPEAQVQLEPISPALGIQGDGDALALALEQLIVLGAETGPICLRASSEGERVLIEIEAEGARWSEAIINAPTALSEPGSGHRRFPGLSLAVAATVARDHCGQLRTLAVERGGKLLLELPLAPCLPG